MNINIRELDHVVLRVSDIDRALHFYCGVLGCTEERRVDKIGLSQLRAGSSLIDLVDVKGELGKNGAPHRVPKVTTWTTSVFGSTRSTRQGSETI